MYINSWDLDFMQAKTLCKWLEDWPSIVILGDHSESLPLYFTQKHIWRGFLVVCI